MKKLLSTKNILIGSSILIVLLITVISFIVVPSMTKSQEKSNELSENYDELLLDYEQLSEEREELQEIIAEQKEQINSNDDYLKEIDQLKDDIVKKENVIDELENKVEELEEEIEQLKQDLLAKNEQSSSPPNYDKNQDSLKDKSFSTNKDADKKVFLTFDDGPTSVTPSVLDILDEANIPASFFVIGQRMENNPSIMKRAYNDGHAILPHSYSHDYAIYSTFDTFYDDLAKAEQVYEEVLQVSPPSIFRFPGGSSNHSSFQYGGEQFMPALTVDVKENNYTYVDWNVSSGDAGPNANHPNKMLNAIKEQSKGKDFIVLLCHDSATNNSLVEILPDVINYYGDHGYSFRSFRDITEEELNELENRSLANKPIIR